MRSLRQHSPGIRSLALAILVVGLLGDARAASKYAVAVMGDTAPGGGIFAGPGFTGWPTAAGIGWVGFRGQVSGGSTIEALVVAHMVDPITRTQVASIGQAAPGGGNFKQFVGRPVVNANGDVAFAAQVTLGDGEDDDPAIPTPAGIFLFRAGTLTSVARSGQVTAGDKIDLLASVDPNADPTDVLERTPALNDAGDVAFLAAVRDDAHTSGGIFLALVGRGPTPVVRIGDRFDGGTFSSLGPPALNAGRLLAFHGMVATPDEPVGANQDGFLDGIFTAGPDGADPALVVAEGAPAMPTGQPLLTFEDDVSLNDAGHVVFLAGPLNNKGDLPDPLADSPGVVECAGGVLTALAYPGLQVGDSHITAFKLGPAQGSVAVPPVVSPDDHVAFLASLDGGTQEAIVVWDGNAFQFPLLYTNGISPDPTPEGGTYAGASSGPAIDATGALAFRARIAGGVTSEAVVYQPQGATGVVTGVGDSAPSAGFFSGKPFSAPVMNDAGDVAFRAFLARGSASVGIFRDHLGTLEALVHAGDATPRGDRFLDLVGQPSMNALGAVAFAGQTSKGVGIYVVDQNGIRIVVEPLDDVPNEDTAAFKSVFINPALNDAGSVAFRAVTLATDPDTSKEVSRDGIFVADAGGIRRIVGDGDPAPSGDPFFRLHDPVITNVPSVAFRASLGMTQETSTGVFVADDTGLHEAAVGNEDLGAGITLTRVTSDPIATSSGDLAFLATRARQVTADVTKALGPSILHRSADGLGLVVAQDMPGPAGGTFRSLAAPAVNSLGHIAFRGSFLPFTGGIGGIFLTTEAGLDPYLLVGEGAPGGGRISSLGNKLALNANDDVAFTATVAHGVSRTGLFVASRTQLRVAPIAIHLGGRGARDHIRVALALALGHLSNGVDPTTETVIVSVSDAHGVLWSVTVTSKQLKHRGKAFVAVPKTGSTLAHQLTGLRLQVKHNGTPVVTASSANLNLTQNGQRPLEAPITVSLQVGDDGGTRVLPCRPGRHGLRCRAS